MCALTKRKCWTEILIGPLNCCIKFMIFPGAECEVVLLLTLIADLFYVAVPTQESWSYCPMEGGFDFHALYGTKREVSP